MQRRIAEVLATAGLTVFMTGTSAVAQTYPTSQGVMHPHAAIYQAHQRAGQHYQAELMQARSHYYQAYLASMNGGRPVLPPGPSAAMAGSVMPVAAMNVSHVPGQFPATEWTNARALPTSPIARPVPVTKDGKTTPITKSVKSVNNEEIIVTEPGAPGLEMPQGTMLQNAMPPLGEELPLVPPGAPGLVENPGATPLPPPAMLEGQKPVDPPAHEDPKTTTKYDVLCTTADKYFARAGGFYMRRDRGSTIFLADEFQGVAGTSTVFDRISANTVAFDAEAGFLAVVGMNLNECDAIEGSYTGLVTWAGSDALNRNTRNGVTSSLQSPFLFQAGQRPQLIPADRISFNYSSELDQAELNYRRKVADCDYNTWTMISGLRYVNLSEGAELVASVAGNNFERTISRAENNILVAQVGAEYLHAVGQRLGLGIKAKAGVGVNFADQDIENRVNGVTRNTFGEDEIALVTTLDAGVFATFQLTRHIFVRGGYDILFLGGVALAPEQLGTTNWDLFFDQVTPGVTGADINANGNALYHGPSISVEIRWGGAH